MSVVVTERDEDHKSREFRALGRRCWDVHQQGLLVGVFYSEQEAHAYRQSLEQDEARRHAQAAERF
ncbi:hypothetical protein SAMN05216189_102482 [Pseudomonas delhiensis]|uniref:Uncharacterized protein n=1 Tax=Pseudomonas delhiensis TaxID=366289 RepID=A0A239M6W3_9PSED|nr:hypothetical protein [Pseudomonas delhiensis]SDJ87940.1 hypothetical protein SAMN05216189_102482 [Pseudomonas delhiensis]SNT38647.1 hypothetical protein SAMN06295949_12482 [Pseudomonas delhiensis]